jgi:hypothetical protein
MPTPNVYTKLFQISNKMGNITPAEAQTLITNVKKILISS